MNQGIYLLGFSEGLFRYFQTPQVICSCTVFKDHMPATLLSKTESHAFVEHCNSHVVMRIGSLHQMPMRHFRAPSQFPMFWHISEPTLDAAEQRTERALVFMKVCLIPCCIQQIFHNLMLQTTFPFRAYKEFQGL